MITIATFNTPDEAYLLLGQLESAGIPVFINGENAPLNSWLPGNILGGIKVQVADAYLAAAEAYLAAPPLPPEA